MVCERIRTLFCWGVWIRRLTKGISGANGIACRGGRLRLLVMEEAAKAYEAVRGYCVKDGMICKLTAARDGEGEPYPKPLCTFFCLPREEITQDDGVTTSTMHEVRVPALEVT